MLMQPVSTKVTTVFYHEIKAGLQMELREVPKSGMWLFQIVCEARMRC